MQRKYEITSEGVHSCPNINRKSSKCDPKFVVRSLEMLMFSTLLLVS